jgi:TPR repeat protein
MKRIFSKFYLFSKNNFHFSKNFLKFNYNLEVENIFMEKMKNFDNESDFKKSLEEEVEKKDPKSLLLIGMLHLLGNVYPVDIEKGLEYLKEASDQGNGESSRAIGIQYSKEKNFESSEEYFKKAIEQGNHESYYDLCVLYINNNHLEKSLEYAYLNYKFNQNSESKEIFFEIAKKFESTDMKKSIEIYQFAVSENEPKSMQTLGLYLIIGTFIEKDEFRGMDLLKRSANLGNIDSSIIFGGYLLSTYPQEALKYLGTFFF